MLRKIAFAACLVAGCAVAGAAELGGRYEVRGTNLDGSRYSGTATITVTSNTTCEIVWKVGTTASGICMRNGIAFAAGYAMGKDIGLVIYEIKSDGTLDGRWTIAGRNGVGTELLIPTK